jgi:DNA-binding MarR family transcriptional regulator
VQTAQAAVLTVMRLFRGLERVDTGLTPQQYRILKLAGAGGERSARLAERLAVAKPTLTATADGLVAAGYAQREAEAGDRRVVRLRLTAAGRAALERAGHGLAGPHDQVHARQRVLRLPGVPEPDVGEFDLSPRAAGRPRVRGLRRAGRLAEQVLDPPQADGGLVVAVEDLGQLLHGRKEQVDVEHARDPAWLTPGRSLAGGSASTSGRPDRRGQVHHGQAGRTVLRRHVGPPAHRRH